MLQQLPELQQLVQHQLVLILLVVLITDLRLQKRRQSMLEVEQHRFDDPSVKENAVGRLEPSC